ncbi:hypothetical protein A3K89_22035 [Rhodococcoides kyotonense]|uniref:Uncharacterized protein n=2 Tax=Rhodococcoides kyotonense TaxID=398843 RepID=A0A177YE45_9NOCA|nr:hypothetical protein A3K89_22035 [Rhodococcus kyotonensis]
MVLPRLSAAQMPTLMNGVAATAGPPMTPLLHHHHKQGYPDPTRPPADVEKFLSGPRERRTRTADEKTTNYCYTSFGATTAAVTEGHHAYFVSPDMSALVLAGAARSADVPVTVADLPSPAGVAYFKPQDGPFFLLWYVSLNRFVHLQKATRTGMLRFLEQDGTTGLEVGSTKYLPLPTFELLLSPPDSDIAPDPASLRIDNAHVPQHTDPQQLQDVQDIGAGGKEVMSTFLSFVNMIRQEKLAGRTETTSRVRRSASTKLVSNPVTYIYYKRTESSSPADAANSVGRRPASRHPVRGHWKRQWYPSQQRHHPVFIVEYLRGQGEQPNSAPNKVNMVT